LKLENLKHSEAFS